MTGMTLHIPRIPSLLTASAAALSLAVLTGCGNTISDSARQPPEPTERQTAEAAGPAERIALTYDGGVMVLDAESHEVLGNFEAEGFTRLNAAGDNRHLFLTEGDSFRLLDMGTWSEPHGDHSHSYTTDPLLTDQRIEGSHPGHLINHDGTSVAFFDGTGEIHSFDPAELSADAPIKTEKTQAKEAHHGVAVVRTDGSMIHTVGNEDTRSGVVIRDADGTDIAGNSDCPGVHGEAAVKDGVITVGCENGLLIITDDEITKVDSPDEHGRIGNQRGHEGSPVVLGDYKTDPEAEVERPTRVTLTDTTSGKQTRRAVAKHTAKVNEEQTNATMKAIAEREQIDIEKFDVLEEALDAISTVKAALTVAPPRSSTHLSRSLTRPSRLTSSNLRTKTSWLFLVRNFPPLYGEKNTMID